MINKSNVASMKAVWRASLRGSGMSPRAGNQAQPLVYDGVVYIMTGDNDAFAVLDRDGPGAVGVPLRQSIRKWRGPAAPGWGAGSGWAKARCSSGSSTPKLVALDQVTGKVLWSVQAGRPEARLCDRERAALLQRPRHHGLCGQRPRHARPPEGVRRKDGKLRWTFYTVPGPGEFGHDTWPEGSDVWKHGGAAIWQTPAIDPELGLIYFSTANPGPC